MIHENESLRVLHSSFFNFIVWKTYGRLDLMKWNSPESGWSFDSSDRMEKRPVHPVCRQCLYLRQANGEVHVKFKCISSPGGYEGA
jgi:hypothetical protein